VTGNMSEGDIYHAAVRDLAPHILLFRNGAATMTEDMQAQTFSVHCGQSSRLLLARRYFIASYLRVHGFANVHSEEGDTGVAFSMMADGRTYKLQVSEAWLVASTHTRVEERLDRLDACRKMREHGAAYLDVTSTGQEVLIPSL
jgi:hypothetical protein